MKTSLRWASLFSKNTLHHQVKHAYQMIPTQFLAIRNRLTSSSSLVDCTYWTMILLGSHLFLRGFEICDILLKNVYVSEVEFEDDEPWLVKRVKLGVWRKGNCFTNFQVSREDGFPKLCLVRQLLVYIHCCNIDVINNDSERPLFPCVENASRKMCKETFGRYLESLSKDVLGIPDDIRGLTIHSLRNMGYVLSVWGDGAIEDAIYDANHSPTAKSYEKYTRDTSLKYNNWKTDNHVSSAVNVLVPVWKKKKFFGNEVYGAGNLAEGSSLNYFAKMFVLNVLKVDSSNGDYRNPLTLINKALSVREPGSNVSIILRFLNNYGSEEEKTEVRNALFRERICIQGN